MVHMEVNGLCSSETHILKFQEILLPSICVIFEDSQYKHSLKATGN